MLVRMTPPSKLADRAAGDAAQQVEDRELDHRHGAPQRQALVFVVVALAIDAEQQLFEIAGVLADEIRRDEPIEDRMQDVGPAVVDRNALGAVLRAHAKESARRLSVRQLNRFDDDRIVETIQIQHRSRGGYIKFIHVELRSALRFGPTSASAPAPAVMLRKVRRLVFICLRIAKERYHAEALRTQRRKH